ncbi:MAG: DUF2178 domain-containing protein [Candidatus Pacebacteria bacterium]|nr:DUF2178 domain-containing protein [Candidatus Paceibacterota bacterium]MDD2757476.1 DUF2178 domain-containing protein [Candidatus Paceibacterota bacterium]MDD3970084.1 DUF2178 domain-containing protein [Candidatus Paceibacterota bacterium]
MSYKVFKNLRILVIIFIAVTISIAVNMENVILAVSAIVIGMIAMIAIKKNVKELKTDEMIQSIAGKSSLWAYSICIPFLALLSVFFMFSNLSNKGSDVYNLGIILSYIVLFHIAVYSIAFMYLRNKYNSDDK